MSAAQLIRFALALVLCALLCFQLVAAGDVERDLSYPKEPAPHPKPQPQPQPQPQPKPQPQPQPKPQPAPQPQPQPAPQPAPHPKPHPAPQPQPQPQPQPEPDFASGLVHPWAAAGATLVAAVALLR